MKKAVNLVSNQFHWLETRVLVATLVLSCVVVLASCAERTEQMPDEAQFLGLKRMEVLEAAQRFETDFPGSSVEIDEETGLPNLIRIGHEPLASSTTSLALEAEAWTEPEDVARQFFGDRGAELFGMEAAENNVEVLSETSDPDFPDETVVRVRQTVNGVPVWGSEAIVELDPAAQIQSIAANFRLAKTVRTVPELSSEAAVERASAYRLELQTMAAALDPDGFEEPEDTAEAERTTLQLFDPSAFTDEVEGRRLVWIVTFDDYDFFVDASSGEILYYVSNYAYARDRQTFDRNNTTSSATLVLTETGPVQAQTVHADATAAHEHAKAAYDYFFGLHQRDSFDDAGSAIKSFVRHDNLKNAKWKKTDRHMVYGPGYALPLDVAVHEFTHGVVQSMVGLPYKNEQGALDEFLADFFAIAVEFETGTSDWQIGEALPGQSSADPLRSLQDPTKGRFDASLAYDAVDNDGQPDHYTDLVRTSDEICKTTRDFFTGCVHFNSGILNKAAFLAALGGTHRGITVRPIGLDKLERVIYRSMVRLHQSSKLSELASKAGTACERLAQGSVHAIDSDDCRQLDLAFEAVGL